MKRTRKQGYRLQCSSVTSYPAPCYLVSVTRHASLSSLCDSRGVQVVCPGAARFYTQATGKLMGSFPSRISKNLEAGAEMGN